MRPDVESVTVAVNLSRRLTLSASLLPPSLYWSRVDKQETLTRIRTCTRDNTHLSSARRNQFLSVNFFYSRICACLCRKLFSSARYFFLTMVPFLALVCRFRCRCRCFLCCRILNCSVGIFGSWDRWDYGERNGPSRRVSFIDSVLPRVVFQLPSTYPHSPLGYLFVGYSLPPMVTRS